MIKTNDTITPAKAAANRLSGAVNFASDQTIRGRKTSVDILWKTKDVAPEEILAGLDTPSKSLIMKTDLLVRILTSLEAENPLAAFIASSPIPADKDVVLRDANGDVVDVSAEVVALLTKLVSVKAASIVDKE